MYKIELIPGMGRGLVATQDIPNNTEVVVNHLHIFTENETKYLNHYNNTLKLYLFSYMNGRDCLCLGDGELFNHSKDYNVVYHFDAKRDKVLGPVMVFTTSRDIKKGEQLFIDYTQDDPTINIQDYL